MNDFFTLLMLVLSPLAVVIAVKLYNEYMARLRHVQRLNYWKNRTDPVIVISNHPKDDTVFERAEELRQLLIESGNNWDVMVHAMPFGDIYPDDPERDDFYLEYVIRAGKVAEKLRTKHRSEHKEADEEYFNAFVLGQKVR